MREMRLRLLEQLGKLETEQYQNAVDTVEVHRRLYTLAQVKSWSLPGAGPLSTCPEGEAGMQLVTRLVGKLTHPKVELIEDLTSSHIHCPGLHTPSILVLSDA